MHITEIYRSVQGESSYTGIPCIFVRLTGCNLRCTWCDTEYAFAGGRRMSLDEVMAAVRDAGPAPLVEITGGEPMLQEHEVVPLMEALLSSGFKVLLETSGERPLGNVPPPVIKILDVKCPASGEGDTFRMENLAAIQPHDEIKFVIASHEDYEFARDFIRRHNLQSRAAHIILSPAFRKDASGLGDTSQCLVDPRNLVDWILADALPARLGLQTHKFIWDPATKGV